MSKVEIREFIKNNRVQIILLCALMVAMVVFLIYFHIENSKKFYINQNSNHPKLTVTIDKPKSWSEGGGALNTGAEYDFTITNPSSITVDHWDMDIKVVPGVVIDSSWAGTYEMDGDVIHATGLDYNIDIPPHDAVTFGFVLHTVGPMEITDFLMSYTTESRITDNPVFYILLLAILLVLTIMLTGFYNHIKYIQLQRRTAAVQKVMEQSFETFSRIIDAKDRYTEGHSRRVAIYSREIAKRIGMSEEEQENIYYVAMLHDIGKIGVPDQILNKPNKLDETEFEIIRSHAEIGGDILKEFTGLPGASDGARHHHERFDGMGYPDRMKGNNIPIAARIICIADSFDAMSSDRIYRKKLDIERIKIEFIKCSGTQFDPELVPVIVNMIAEGTVPVDLDAYDKEH